MLSLSLGLFDLRYSYPRDYAKGLSGGMRSPRAIRVGGLAAHWLVLYAY